MLAFGPHQLWPVLIAPDDFALVTQTTGHHAWGVQSGNVVVGDPRKTYGRRAVVKIVAGLTGRRMRSVFRDDNPLNLMRENIGVRGQGGTFWLALGLGETDPIHFGGAFPNRTPAAIMRQRETVRPPRDPSRRDYWTQRHA